MGKNSEIKVYGKWKYLKDVKKKTKYARRSNVLIDGSIVQETKEVRKETKWRVSFKRDQNKKIISATVRRVIYFTDGSNTQERMYPGEYRKYDNNESKIREFLARKNHRLIREEQERKAFDIKTAFIKREHVLHGYYE